jgi:hypothetical protein
MLTAIIRLVFGTQPKSCAIKTEPSFDPVRYQFEQECG